MRAPLGERELAGKFADAESLRKARLSERIYQRLHGVMAFFGVLFLAVVISERLVDPREPLRSLLIVIGWATWAVFVLEFATRFALAPAKIVFLRRYWWQLLLLAIPFLNAVRAFAAARVTRLGRVLGAGLRGTRSARNRLAGRLGWLVSITVIVVIVAADLLYQFADYPSYASALHDAALATITGQRTDASSGIAQLLEVVLAVYSVVIFASLAGALGAHFLSDDRRDELAGPA